MQDDCEEPRFVTLKISLPGGYPTTDPPHFQLNFNSASLKANDHEELKRQINDIYRRNIGEPVIYRWVERIREFISASKYRSAIALSGSNLDQTYSNKKMNIQSIKLPVQELSANIFTGNTIQDRKSTFQPFLSAVSNPNQVNAILDKLRETRKIQNATHIIYAYRIRKDSKSWYENSDDDGETRAGPRLLHLLQKINAENVMVIVVRWYGGIHLGVDRFKHINQCAKGLLEACGFI